MDTRKAIVRIDQFRNIQLERGKALLSVEQWAKFGYCPDCDQKKCDSCEREIIAISHIYNFLPRDVELDDFPAKLWCHVIRCCLCGSKRHILYWIQETFWPELFDLPEVEKTVLRALRARRTQS